MMHAALALPIPSLKLLPTPPPLTRRPLLYLHTRIVILRLLRRLGRCGRLRRRSLRRGKAGYGRGEGFLQAAEGNGGVCWDVGRFDGFRRGGVVYV